MSNLDDSGSNLLDQHLIQCVAQRPRGNQWYQGENGDFECPPPYTVADEGCSQCHVLAVRKCYGKHVISTPRSESPRRVLYLAHIG